MFDATPVNECCGCMACVEICPQNVLGVRKDTLGFSYPQIVKFDSCLNCDLCNKVCPQKKSITSLLNVGEVYCGYNRNIEERLPSSSGGVFTSICKYVINNNGVCYGAAFTEEYFVKHIKITSIDDIKAIRGSKYIESNVNGIYRDVEKELYSGKLVLFSGTPCQAHGLTNYLRKQYANLIIVDLFCYGIPSPDIWRRWINYVNGSKQPIDINFRDKTYGWDNYALKIRYYDGTEYCNTKDNDLYLAYFSKGAFIRKSCFNCKLKAFPRVSDLTLGDFQELKHFRPNEDPKDGWSMIKVNSRKGEQVLEIIEQELHFYRVSDVTMNNMHPEIGRASVIHPNRQILEDKIDSLPIYDLLKKYAAPTYKMRIKIKMIKFKESVKKKLEKVGIIQQ